MKTETIEQSIIQSVNYFNEAKKEFSIFDITSFLRDRINDGDLEIDSLPREDVTDEHDVVIKNTQFLSHYFVKTIFQSLFQAGKLDCEIFHGGKFNVYRKEHRIKILNPNAVIKGTIIDDTIPINKIEQYVRNRSSKSATIKQIQSRLKRKGVFCVDIRDAIVQHDRNLKIKQAPHDKISKYIVQWTNNS